MGKHNIYIPKAQTSINLDKKTLEFLRFLKKNGYVVSISESVREMLNFALPFFINMHKVKNKIVAGKIKDFSFIAPTPDKVINLIKSYPTMKTENRSLKNLRKDYPDVTDYKFINEKPNKK